MEIPKTTDTINCDNVVKCIFNLNEFDIKVLKELKKRKNIRADDLATILKKERSTVYRSLQKLTKCGICKKTTMTLKKGGYYHSYSCLETSQIKRSAEKCLEEWYRLMKKTLTQLNE